MPSLTDVARAAGVSLTTASMVLNKGKQQNRVSAACAQRVREAARSLGYVPNYHARSMKLGRAEVLAVAMDIGHEDAQSMVNLELSHPYFGYLCAGIERRLRAIGHLMALVGPTAGMRAPDRALLGVRQRRFDGVIVFGSVVRPDLTGFLGEPADAPVVVIEPILPTEYPTVVFGEEGGIELAVRHLAELGHRGLLYVRDGDRRMPVVDMRAEAFKKACAAASLRGEMIEVPHSGLELVHHPDRQIAIAERKFGEFVRSGKLQGGKITGVMCYNDTVAIGVMQAITRAGLAVPRDVSVVGFDDTVGQYATPRLTSVSHELSEMGQVATDLCMEMVNRPESIEKLRGSKTVVKATLTVGQSSGAAPAR